MEGGAVTIKKANEALHKQLLEEHRHQLTEDSRAALLHALFYNLHEQAFRLDHNGQTLEQ